MAENKRILILSTAYLPLIGGSELAIKNITDRISDFKFDLITGRPNDGLPIEETIGNVHVYRVGGALSRTSIFLPKVFLPFAIASKACKLRRLNRYSLVHAYQASQAAGAAWLLKLAHPSLPMLVTIQEGKNLDSQSPLIKLFRRAILNKADRFTVISSYLKNYLLKQGINKLIEMIPNGVDVNIFKPHSTEDNLKMRTGLNIGGEDKIITTTSRLVEKNGIADLIRAFAIVKQHYDKPVFLLIIGDGPLRNKLENEAVSLGLKLGQDVVFMGSLAYERLPQYLSCADIFVRPSHSEGLGTAFLEAMACGLPVIGTPVGGIKDFLIDNETGLMCRVNDSADIAEKMERLLNNDAEAERLAKAGRELVERKYTWQKSADEFNKLYHGF